MTDNQIRDGTLLTEKHLHPYQAFCVGFIETHPACGIFLDMGLGKTSIALTAIEHLLHDSFEVSRILIIAPLRVARDTWLNELAKWAHLRNLRMERVIGSPKERVAALSRKAELYIINRENVEWLVKHYAGRKLPFDMLVIDELSLSRLPATLLTPRATAVRQTRVSDGESTDSLILSPPLADAPRFGSVSAGRDPALVRRAVRGTRLGKLPPFPRGRR